MLIRGPRIAQPLLWLHLRARSEISFEADRFT